MADNKRKATKNEKMSMKENERLLIEKFKMIKPVEKSCEEQAKRHRREPLLLVCSQESCHEPDGQTFRQFGIFLETLISYK